MSQWAEIEAAAEQPAATTRSRAETGGRPGGARRRLRRHQRLAVGSFDAGAHRLQRNGREVIVGSALFMIPMFGLDVLTSVLVFDRFDDVEDAALFLPSLLGGVEAASGVELIAAYFTLLITSLTAALVGGYATGLVLADMAGAPLSIRSSARRALRLLPALVIAWLIGHIWLWLGALVLVNAEPETLAALAFVALPLGAMVIACTVLVSPAIVAESLGPIAGLRRGWQLMRTRFGACCAFVCVCVLIGGGLQFGIAYLPRLAETTGLVTFGRWVWLAEGVARQIGSLLVVPLVAIATAELYVQLRIDAEGLDIVVAAEAAFPETRR